MSRRSSIIVLVSVTVVSILLVPATLVWRHVRVPPKYQAVDINRLTAFHLDQNNGTIKDIPAQWRRLDGTRISLVGCMWAPTPAADGSLQTFQLVADKAMRSYQPAPPVAQWFIDASVVPGVSVSYDSDKPVRVDGILHVRLKSRDGVLSSVFSMDVDSVQPAP